MEININVKFEDRFIKVLEGLGKVYAVIQPDRIDEGRQRAIEATEAVQKAFEAAQKAPKIEAPEKKTAQEAVPTETPAYTFEQIQVACANLAREGKRTELGNLIKDFGLASLPDLKEDQYNAFALKLREIGGTI